MRSRLGGRAGLTGCLLLTCLASPHAVTDSEPLQTLIERLARQGESILFSTDVVDPAMVVDAAADSVPALRDALAGHGLTVERLAGHWVVTRAPDRQPPAEDAPAPVSLPPPAPAVENIIVTGSRHRLAGRQTSGSIATLEGGQLAAVPTMGSDAMRAVSRLPGMAGVGVSAKPRIRGGLQDEMLVRLDGVELLDPYHLADFHSIFSVIDDRAVAAVDVYTGGFPARYGNRMSGVLDITTGIPGGGPRTEVGLSLFSLLANSHGTANDGSTEYFASVRRGTLDQITAEFDPEIGDPRYYDALAQIHQRLSPVSRLSAGVLLSKDDVVLREEDETFAQSDIDTRYAWTRLALQHGARIDSTSTLAFTWSSRRKKFRDADDDSATGGYLNHLQQLRKVSARTDLTARLEHTLLEMGAELEYGRTRFQSRSLVNRGPLGVLVSGSSMDGHAIDTDPDGFAGGAYLSAEFALTPWLWVQPGLRWDFQDFDPRGTTRHLSPRLGLRFEPAETLSIHVDVGRFHQPEALHELQVSDGESRYFAPQQADHVMVGFDWLAADGWEVALALYDKRYRHPKTRYENLFNPFVLVPELEADRVAIAPERARARGADLEVHRQLTRRARASLGYSYLDAEDRLNGGWVPRRWSQRHTANATLAWQGASTTAAISLTWHSGWRGARLPGTVTPDTVLDLDSVMNRVELRDFLTVDASVRRSWNVGRSEVTAFLSVTNLTNRRNVAGIEYEIEAAGDLLALTREREHLMPLVPSLGVLVAF